MGSLILLPIFIMYVLDHNNGIQMKANNEIEVIIKRESRIFIYGNNGNILCTQNGDEIIGYTCRTFAIRKGKAIHVFDSTGQPLYSRPC